MKAAAKPVSLSGQIGISIGASALPILGLLDPTTPVIIRALAVAAITLPIAMLLVLHRRRQARS